MKQVVLILLCCCTFLSIEAQTNLMPIHSYYKDQFFYYQDSNSSSTSFFPISENEFGLRKQLTDTSLQYYDLTNWLLKKNWLELKGKDYFIRINPAVDISKGRDVTDSIPFGTYQNTRGYIIDGELLDNFSFSTSFFENQAIFNKYETSYYQLAGERFPTANDTIYSIGHASIPNGGRTKPFKIGGFDYAYAIGTISYQPKKWWSISSGNNAHFIGAGHRSLLLSDNSHLAPYLQNNFKIGQHWSYSHMRSRLINMYRRPAKSTAEAYYLPKALSVNYLTYHNKGISFSLFDGAIWSKGTTRSSKNVPVTFYNPIPFMEGATRNADSIINQLSGLNLEYQYKNQLRIYSQLAVSNYNFDAIGFQLGARIFHLFGLKNSQLQLEYNNLPNQLYQHVNPHLNYTNFNLPLAHTKGVGFQEFVQRFSYEYNRFYIDEKFVYYQLSNYQSDQLLAYVPDVNTNGKIHLLQVEMGYRINKNVNSCVYVKTLLRNANYGEKDQQTKFLQVGLRTAIINHYNDF